MVEPSRLGVVWAALPFFVSANPHKQRDTEQNAESSKKLLTLLKP